MGWVNLAMVKILDAHPRREAPARLVMFWPGADRRSITTISGLWAVLWTDLLQFVVKMAMVIVLAVFAVHAVGGISGLKPAAALQHHDARRAPASSVAGLHP